MVGRAMAAASGTSPRTRSGPHQGLRNGRRREVLRVRGADSKAQYSMTQQDGTSPRARSGPADRVRPNGDDRNISASRSGSVTEFSIAACCGTFPAMRSGLVAVSAPTAVVRSISACAEQILRLAPRTSACGEHLRVRGDALDQSFHAPVPLRNISLRMRSRRHAIIQGELGHRNISAYEQTFLLSACSRSPPEHLRLCGADPRLPADLPRPSGTSPRKRSGQRGRRPVPHRHRNISACAERATPTSSASRTRRGRLRVHGADCSLISFMSMRGGTSPRARSRCVYPLDDEIDRRNISAYAELTSRTTGPSPTDPEHLHVRGADVGTWSSTRAWRGTSPRTRSGPLATWPFVCTLLFRYQGALCGMHGASGSPVASSR